MFGEKSKGKKLDKKTTGHPATLAGLVKYPRSLYRTYKGREIKAILTPRGIIKLGKKRFTSPTAAAKAVIDRKGAVNGWKFWYIKDKDGEWVRLSEYRS